MFISVPWCSGHHVCLTRRRSRVRASSEPDFFSLNINCRSIYLEVIAVCVLDLQGNSNDFTDLLLEVDLDVIVKTNENL